MDKPPLIALDEDVLEGLKHLTEVCGDNFILVGASARDILMQQHKIQPMRATRDADLAIRVRSWDLYANIRTRILALGFKAQTTEHSFHYKTALFDILPFGEILTDKSELLWPQDGKIMNMLGFEDAYRTSHKFRTKSNIEIRIASLSSLVLLKIIAWNDRPRERSQDPIDISIIAENYLDAGNFDRLYDENSDLIEMPNFTLKNGGSALIGRDLFRLFSPQSIEGMKLIIQRELNLAEASLFFQQMAGTSDIRSCIENIEIMLSNLK